MMSLSILMFNLDWLPAESLNFSDIIIYIFFNPDKSPSILQHVLFSWLKFVLYISPLSERINFGGGFFFGFFLLLCMFSLCVKSQLENSHGILRFL